jgi:hypothetical protein
VSNEDSVCPLWVKSGHDDKPARCPLYPQKQTFWVAVEMSANWPIADISSFIRLTRRQAIEMMQEQSTQASWRL